MNVLLKLPISHYEPDERRPSEERVDAVGLELFHESPDVQLALTNYYFGRISGQAVIEALECERLHALGNAEDQIADEDAEGAES